MGEEELGSLRHTHKTPQEMVKGSGRGQRAGGEEREFIAVIFERKSS